MGEVVVVLPMGEVGAEKEGMVLLLEEDMMVGVDMLKESALLERVGLIVAKLFYYICMVYKNMNKINNELSIFDQQILRID